MNFQYISDNKGKTTGVFIPIQDWDKFVKKHNIPQEEVYTVPEWHKEVVRNRVKNAKSENYIPWNKAKKNL